jgi:putative transposase
MSNKVSYYLHAYARGVDKRSIFADDLDRIRFLFTLVLALRPNSPSPLHLLEKIKLNHFTPRQFTPTTLNRLYGKPAVTILSAILMPNHFHLQLKYYQLTHKVTFFRRLMDSYTKYFNTRHKREGRLFSSSIKTVPILKGEQNIFLSKYIHTNPIKSKPVNINKTNLDQYRWSTYPLYLGKSSRFTIKKGFDFDSSYFCRPQEILSQFKSVQEYRHFIIEPIDYTPTLNPKEFIDNV